MKRASYIDARYVDAIEWIAENDSAAVEGALDPLLVRELVTSMLVADIFNVPPEQVGHDVVRYRSQRCSYTGCPVPYANKHHHPSED